MTIPDKIMEMLWNYIPEDVDYSVNAYNLDNDKPTELYIYVYGKCYQIVVNEHPHPDEEGANW